MREKFKQNEWWLVMAMMAGGLSLFFLILVDNYLDKDGLTRWDLAIYQWVEHIRTPLLNKLMLLVTLTANWQILIWGTLLAGILLFIANKRRYLMTMLTSLAFGAVFTEVTKLIFSRPRPPIENALIKAGGYSFPSGHSYFAIVFYGLITYFWVKHFKNRRIQAIIGILGVSLGLMIGISRIYLGVHWTTDVLAGLASSGVWWLLIVGYIEYKNRYFAQEYKDFNHKLVWRGFWLFTGLWLMGIGVLFLGQK